MDYRLLGQTGLSVSRLCFGALTIGPLQANLPLLDGAAVIKAAQNAGVNFIDTAELYGTYQYIGKAIREHPHQTVICAKSYAYTYDGMRHSVEQACRGIGRDYIDIFMLHEQTSRMTLKGHGEALDYLVDAKQKGLIRAAGVSTHYVEVVRAAAMIDEIEVIHPILNIQGIGICDGTVTDMLEAIQFAAFMGKGIYTMKALGGGHLSSAAADAFSWILEQQHITAVAVGMQSPEEVAYNCAFFAGKEIPETLAVQVANKPRRLLVEDWCVGCGCCAEKCPMDALQIVDGKARCQPDRCVLCGYCGAYCPEFCLKII